MGDTPLEKAHAKLRQMKQAGIKIKKLNPIERAQQNPKSLKRAIEAKCYDCAYDSKNPGNWRTQVFNCGAPDCPLYAHRPRPSR